MESSSDTNGDARKRAINTLIAKLLATMDDPTMHEEALKELQEAILKPPIAMQEEGVEGLPSREVTFVPSSLLSQGEHVKPTYAQVETSQQRGVEEIMHQPKTKERQEKSNSPISNSDAAPRR